MENVIIVFSHSNYLLKSSGTEKFMKDVYSLYNDNGYNVFHVFSISNLSKLPFFNKFIGINYNKQFIGVFKYQQIISVLNFLVRDVKYVVHGVHIQHLNNLSFDEVRKIITSFNVPVHIFLHDTYSLGYRNYIYEKKIYAKYCNFYLNIKSLIYNFIVPSEFFKIKWLSSYPEFSSLIQVRPHLCITFQENTYKKENLSKEKIRIAFLGKQIDIKGFNEWIEISNYIKIKHCDKYELFYIGTDQTQLSNVSNIFVDNKKAMMEYKLNELEIDCVFLWSKVEESYSYVYYEALVNHCYVITNEFSGNIAYMVNRYNNGKVFKSLESFKEMIDNSDDFLKRIINYRLKVAGVSYSKNINDDLSMLNISPVIKYTTGSKRVKRSELLSEFYIKRNSIKEAYL